MSLGSGSFNQNTLYNNDFLPIVTDQHGNMHTDDVRNGFMRDEQTLMMFVDA